MKKMTLKDSVIWVIHNMAIGQRFHGNELRDLVAVHYPRAERAYVDTVLRVARRYCRGMYKVVDRTKSLYERI